jgi:hypothetical protein
LSVAEYDRPAALAIDAWNGAPVIAPLRPGSAWGQRPTGQTKPSKFLAPPRPIDKRDWRHEEVGWGVILPNRTDLSDAARAAVDTDRGWSSLITELVAKRGGVVLRYVPELGIGYLRRHYENGPAQDLSVVGSQPGIGRGSLPRYLMIFGSPAEIPWDLQYALNLDRYVGRLDPAPGWENYVEALLDGWDPAAIDIAAPLVWTVDYGAGDITQLMSQQIGAPVWQRFQQDGDLSRAIRLDGADATSANLATALAARRPAFVLTTSHGLTGPADATLAQQIGVPVDADHSVIDLGQLFGGWSPDGAIWYAQACCSAGAAAESRFAGLFQTQDPIGRMLCEVGASAKSCTSPLAQALLGAKRPARAFIGHVEPTFDWTLRDPKSRQPLAKTLVRALYNDLFEVDRDSLLPTPIGLALAAVFEEAAKFFALWSDAIAEIDGGAESARNTALYRKLVALDRQGTVILGDPAVALPLKGSAGGI